MPAGFSLVQLEHMHSNTLTVMLSCHIRVDRCMNSEPVVSDLSAVDPMENPYGPNQEYPNHDRCQLYFLDYQSGISKNALILPQAKPICHAFSCKVMHATLAELNLETQVIEDIVAACYRSRKEDPHLEAQVMVRLCLFSP